MRKRGTALLLAALLTGACAGASALSYDIGVQGSEVALIQEALLALDFYYGDMTDHYGERTQRGVRLFQEEYGLEATGIADDETRERLYQAAGVSAPKISDSLIEMNITLRRGDAGSEVAWLQESLTTLGYYEGEITGSYGALTQEAVRLFQRGSGISSDGVAGRNTIRVIAQEIEALEKLEAETALGDAGLFGGMQPEAEPTVDPESITTLSLGVKNSAVLRLQEDLTQLGFYTGEITGSFGRLTKEAVRLFQRANDIPSDGVAGPITLKAIGEKIEALHAPQVTPTPAPAATPVRNNGLVTLITPRPLATAAPEQEEEKEVSVIRPAATNTPSPVPTATPAPAVPSIGVNSSVGFLSIERELKLYDFSEDVRQLQIALQSLGFYSASPNSYFDLQTKAAVMGYQAAKDLSITGEADKVTLITINDDIFRRLVGGDD